MGIIPQSGSTAQGNMGFHTDFGMKYILPCCNNSIHSEEIADRKAQSSKPQFT